MATFQVRIEDLTGTVGATSDTGAMTDWLTEGARVVADKLNPDRIILYATDKTDADGSTGISLADGRPVSAHKSGYPALRITVNEKAMAADSDSIHYAVSTRPMWYVDVEKGYVLPGGGTIKWFGYPTVEYDDESIDDYPSEALGAVVYYAAIQGEMRIISDLIRTTMAAIAWSAPTVISQPDAASFTWTDAVIGTYTATTLGTTATPPTYTKPTQTFDVAQLETFLETNKDPALSDRQLGRLEHEIKEYNLDIQNELNEFQKEDKAYQGKIAQEIKQAELTQTQILKLAADTTELNKFNELQTLAEQVQEYQTVLAVFQTNVSNYAAQVGREASRIGAEIQQYTAMYAGYFELLKNLKEEYVRALETL